MKAINSKIVPFVQTVQGTNSTIGTTKHRFVLEKNSKKHYCPDCNKKTFVKYIDTETGDYLPEQYGRCDRESKCSFHLNPYLSGFVKELLKQDKSLEVLNKWKPQQKKPILKPSPETIHFDFETFKQTLDPKRYEKNTFIQNLLFKVKFPFEAETVTRIIEIYRLGTITNGYRSGGITFPFLDIKCNIRAIQVKQFDQQNHTTGTDFLHSIIEKHHIQNKKPLPNWLEAYTKQDKRISCLFGEHLLSKYQSNPIALVEAPKTAVYGALYFGLPEEPESLIWLAVYNKSSFSFDKLKVLKGRIVYVFPDLSKEGNTFKEWENKAKDYEKQLPGTRFIFSDLLEQLAPEQDKMKGLDLADYLIKQDWRLFRKQIKDNQQPKPKPEKVTKSIIQQKSLVSKYEHLEKVEVLENNINNLSNNELQKDWSIEIEQIEKYFEKISLPTEPIKVNRYTTILDCKLYIKSHLHTLKAKKKNYSYLPHLDKLLELKKTLEII